MSDEQDDSLDSLERLSAGTGLRAVSQTDQGPQPALDPELKATLDDMNRRDRVARERIGAAHDETDKPAALVKKGS